jgi:hypothetical protein
VETEVRDEVKKLLIDLVRSDPEVRTALKAALAPDPNGEETRRLASRVAREASEAIERTIRKRYSI